MEDSKIKYDKHFFEKEYIEKRKSLQRIGDELRVSHQTIKKRLEKYNIPIRSVTEAVSKANRERIWSDESRNKTGRAQKGEKNYNWKEKVEIKCKQCRKNFFIKSSKKDTASFCSRSCYGKWMSKEYKGEKNYNWRGGKSFEPYSTEWTDDFKDSIRKRDNYTCQLCRNKQEELEWKLNVHHIDYNKENCDPKNLIALCHSCHSKTIHKDRKKWAFLFNNLIKQEAYEKDSI